MPCGIIAEGRKGVPISCQPGQAMGRMLVRVKTAIGHQTVDMDTGLLCEC